MMKKSHKIIIGFLLMFASYGFIICKILDFEELEQLTLNTLVDSSNLYVLLTIIIFMSLNWSLESIKWKKLIENIQKLNFYYSLKAVLSGISIGIITPNRIGELGGRVAFLNKGNRTAGALATALGSFAQLLITILLGTVSTVLFLILFPGKSFNNSILNFTLVGVCFFAFVLLIWTFFNFKKAKPLLLKIPFLKRREEQLNYFLNTPKKTLLFALSMSLLRYVIFSTQFYLLLLMFEINISPSQAYISISLIYLFATIIPTTTLIELGIRGSLAIFFIGMFSDNTIGITFATFLLWFINLAIPSTIGSLFFIKNKL